MVIIQRAPDLTSQIYHAPPNVLLRAYHPIMYTANLLPRISVINTVEGLHVRSFTVLPCLYMNAVRMAQTSQRQKQILW